MIDYHTHSIYSDGKSTYKEILKEAAKKQLKEIGFSDHLCLKYPPWAIREHEFDKVIEEITLLKIQNTASVEIKFGLEVDYIENMEAKISEIINKFPLDYVIGSVHYINDWNFDTNSKEYHKKDIDQFYREYFRLVQKAAGSGLYDVIGHIDLAKKFRFYPQFNLESLYDETAKILADNGIAFELNTSGRDRQCKEFYPSDNFLKILFENNVPVTLGSDAHKSKEVARYFGKAVNKLKSVGYEKILSFTNREKKYISI